MEDIAKRTRVLDLTGRLAAAQKKLGSNMLAGSVAVGRLLNEAKELLPHGEFQKWRDSHFEGSPQHANRLMRVAREYPGDVPEISLREALKIIANRKKPKPTEPPDRADRKQPPATDPATDPAADPAADPADSADPAADPDPDTEAELLDDAEPSPDVPHA